MQEGTHYPNSSESESDTPPTTTPPTDSSLVGIPLPPKLARAFSLPLPSTLGHLQNPHRQGSQSVISTLSSPSTPSDVQLPTLLQLAADFHAFSVELADTLQMAIQTLLQICPSQLLDPAKEQYSACYLSVPTPSMSSLLTLMKNLNYITARVLPLALGHATIPEFAIKSREIFDVGEILQAVGDAVSGIAAMTGVNIVLYHSDVGMKHVNVESDECVVSYTLSYVLRQLIAISRPGETLEIGLYLESRDSETLKRQDILNLGSSMKVSFRISHHFQNGSQPITRQSQLKLSDFKNPIFNRLLATVHGDFSVEGSQESAHGTTEDNYVLSVLVSAAAEHTQTMQSLSAEEEAVRQPYPNLQLAREPSCSELVTFSESLKGKKVTFHASSSGAFAHRLSSYMTAWGMDISHIPIDNSKSGELNDTTMALQSTSGFAGNDTNDTHSTSHLFAAGGSSAVEESGAATDINEISDDSAAPTFIVIDDDIPVLRRRIMQLIAHNQHLMQQQQRKRPSLVHRPKSSPHIRTTNSLPARRFAVPQLSILHFTSIANYRLVRDLIQSLDVPQGAGPYFLPEVIAIPKPAGPKRFLTAIFTAVNKPLVDPLFGPIATSPFFPSSFDHEALHSPPVHSGRAKITVPSPDIRRLGDRSARSPRDHVPLPPTHPPSPLANEIEAADYFPDSVRRLGSTPASGLLIQSPDGQPAGIFFQPRPRSSKLQGLKGGKPMQREADRRLSSRAETQQKPQTTALASVEVPDKTAGTLTWSPDRSTSPSVLRRKGTSGTEHKEKTDSAEVAAALDGVTSADKISDLREQPPSVKVESQTPVSLPEKKNGTSARLDSIPTPKPKTSDHTIVPPINVLIVEDNPINRTILITFMKRKKIIHDTATNGQEAVNKYRKGTFHLILMDIQMPVMNGIDATKEIRRLESIGSQAGSATVDTVNPLNGNPQNTRSPRVAAHGSSAIIVALTASSLESDRVNALAAGCNDFLTKPVSLIWLNNKIIEWGSLKALQMWANVQPRMHSRTMVDVTPSSTAVKEKPPLPTKPRDALSPGCNCISEARVCKHLVTVQATGDDAQAGKPRQGDSSPSEPSGSENESDEVERVRV